jgi:DNA polymerase-3 subunit delta
VADVAYLVKGNDEFLRARALDELIDELIGDDDRSFAVEEFTVPSARRSPADSTNAQPDEPDDGDGSSAGDEGRESVVSAVVNAASSPPFMTARRIVVLRDVNPLTTADLAPLLRYLDAPLETSVVVFVSGGTGTIAPALGKKVKEIGGEERAPRSEQTDRVLTLAIEESELSFTPAAKELVEQHLGQDAGRVASLVEILRSAYGDDATVDVDDVVPYLGEVGSVPIFNLTNAVENGDSAAALEVLHRLFAANSLHPLQVIGSLLSFYRRVLRLDDPAIRSVDDAIEALGGRVKAFPARKALDASRSLGTDGIRRAFDLLHQADLDLKGARGIPPETVMEVLVVRLARMMPAGGGRQSPRRRARR